MGWLWLIVIGVVIYAIVRKIKKNARIIVIKRNFPHEQSPFMNTRGARPFTRATGQQAQHRLGKETMVKCEHCQVYLPTSEAILIGEKYFCCEEHQRKYFNREG